MITHAKNRQKRVDHEITVGNYDNIGNWEGCGFLSKWSDANSVYGNHSLNLVKPETKMKRTTEAAGGGERNLWRESTTLPGILIHFSGHFLHSLHPMDLPYFLPYLSHSPPPYLESLPISPIAHLSPSPSACLSPIDVLGLFSIVTSCRNPFWTPAALHAKSFPVLSLPLWCCCLRPHLPHHHCHTINL